jgi:ApeA-like protein
MSVVETHEYKGLWWLPSDETEKLSGTLTVTKGEAELELIGHFGHELLAETERERTYPLIWQSSLASSG